MPGKKQKLKPTNQPISQQTNQRTKQETGEGFLEFLKECKTYCHVLKAHGYLVHIHRLYQIPHPLLQV